MSVSAVPCCAVLCRCCVLLCAFCALLALRCVVGRLRCAVLCWVVFAGLCFGFGVPVLFCCVLCCVTTNTLSVHGYVFACVYIFVLCVYLMNKGGQHKGFPFRARWPPSSGLRGRSMSSTAALSAGCLTRYVRTYYFIRVQQMRTYFHV